MINLPYPPLVCTVSDTTVVFMLVVLGVNMVLFKVNAVVPALTHCSGGLPVETLIDSEKRKRLS